MTIRIGYWDCPSCGNKKNLGPNPTCVNCGRPRGANIAFYTDDSAPVVEDPELVARARAGADWICKYCRADNRAGVMDCHRCGAGPDGAVHRAQQFTAAPQPPAPKKASAGKVLAVLGSILAVIGLIIWFLFVRTTSLQMTVQAVSWRKTVEVEQRELKRGESWQDNLPAGARVVGKETRKRPKQVQEGTEKVKVGKKDLGNGMFEDVYEEKPKTVTKDVNDTWVRYELEQWTVAETLEKVTTDGSEPPDPAAGYAVGSGKRLGEARNNAVFTLKGSDGKSYLYEVDASQAGAAALRKYEVGKTYGAQVNTMGKVQTLGP